MDNSLIDQLCSEDKSKIVFLILDGLGGLAMDGQPGSEMETAAIPHLDALAAQSVCGVLDPVLPGVTPGSGPAHFALFGYDPVAYNIGRGVLSAFGVGFEMTENDLAARMNFCTLDDQGRVTDRRAGRIASEIGERLCEKLQNELQLPSGYSCFVLPEKEYRAALVIRGEGLHGGISDTDSQSLGVPPLDPEANETEADATARLVREVIAQARDILANEHPANMILLRGFAKHRRYPSMQDRFKLRSVAIANYPMYRGIAKLLGMSLNPVTPDIPTQIDSLAESFDAFDFFFIHVKYTDARGEDGDFLGKAKVMEEVDKLIPRITALNPDVLVVTGDHSTPAKMKAHSWHPVPVLIRAANARQDRVDRFDEVSCATGGLGRMPSVYLMGLALAHSGRLVKYGA